jgi:hypothetical protein
MLVAGSMAMLVLGVPWRNCAGQLGFFFFKREMRIARGDGLRWRSVGFGFVEYRGINLLLQRKKIATATWRKGETEGD